MPSISLFDACWISPEDRAVFRDLNLRFSSERTGIVGRNGVGKTSLLRVLAGDRTLSSGTLVVDGSVAMMRQEVSPPPGSTIADLFGVADQLAIIERAEGGDATFDELEHVDWTIEERIAAALARVDLVAQVSTPLASLSGGQRTRAALAAAVFREPDFLLLDEPTNNLDHQGREAVARLLGSWGSGLILVSHDRDLLERVDAIVEMTSLGASRYGGNWTDYRSRKAIELEAAQHDLAHAQKHQAEVERKSRLMQDRQAKREASGARKASRGDMPRLLLGARKNAAEAARGGGKRVADRLSAAANAAVEAARARVEVLQQLSIVLPSTGLAADKRVIEANNVSVSYDGERRVIDDLSFSMIGPDRVAIAGPNGSGKSSFLKLVAGTLQPTAGRIQVGVASAFVDQHVAFLDRSKSIIDNFARLNPGATENACRSALAGFLFRAEAALQQVATLSGGEMVRAGLACLLGGGEPPQLLILDEPTNHLDIASVNAVEAALEAYDGALLVVSHDRSFLDNISVNRLLEMGSRHCSGLPRELVET